MWRRGANAIASLLKYTATSFFGGKVDSSVSHTFKELAAKFNGAKHDAAAMMLPAMPEPHTVDL